MRAADRIEGRIDAGAAFSPRGELAHRRDKITGAVVDRRSTEALDHRHVRDRAGANRLESNMTRKVEECRTDATRRTDHENCRTRRQWRTRVSIWNAVR
jgi:hypothetical protein